MAKTCLHLDADTSRKALYTALVARGHDVTRTPNEWMPADADDEKQLLGASAHGRCLLTFNVRDFAAQARRHPHHAGVIFAHQSWTLSDLIQMLHSLLSTTQAEDWIGQVRWLSEWRQ